MPEESGLGSNRRVAAWAGEPVPRAGAWHVKPPARPSQGRGCGPGGAGLAGDLLGAVPGTAEAASPRHHPGFVVQRVMHCQQPSRRRRVAETGLGLLARLRRPPPAAYRPVMPEALALELVAPAGPSWKGPWCLRGQGLARAGLVPARRSRQTQRRQALPRRPGCPLVSDL